MYGIVADVRGLELVCVLESVLLWVFRLAKSVLFTKNVVKIINLVL